MLVLYIATLVNIYCMMKDTTTTKTRLKTHLNYKGTFVS